MLFIAGFKLPQRAYSFFYLVSTNGSTWPAPDVPVCEVVEHGIEEAWHGGQEGLEGVLVSGEGQGGLGEDRRGSKMLLNAPKCS